jgi:dihydroorotate dehydrogenase electron transfer subunit
LGNGFTVTGSAPLLVGGGVGVPPLYGLAKCLRAAGQTPIVILGFNTAEEVFYLEEFRALCATVLLATVDGSAGTAGYVTDALHQLHQPYGALYACGPEPMLRALAAAVPPLPPGCVQFSLEQRMACGFGACMGCTCKTTDGYKRICKDGPVLTREEIAW